MNPDPNSFLHQRLFNIPVGVLALWCIVIGCIAFLIYKIETDHDL